MFPWFAWEYRIDLWKSWLHNADLCFLFSREGMGVPLSTLTAKKYFAQYFECSVHIMCSWLPPSHPSRTFVCKIQSLKIICIPSAVMESNLCESPKVTCSLVHSSCAILDEKKYFSWRRMGESGLHAFAADQEFSVKTWTSCTLWFML